jgi:iron complex outermembrane receptor protein
MERVMKAQLQMLASASLLGLLAAPAFAQSAPAPAPNASGIATGTGGQSEEPGLEQIVVTAQRREENLQRAAVSVTAVSGEALIQRGVTNAQQLTQVAPSLQVSPAGGPYTTFTIRSISNFGGNAFADPAVAVNVAGVYLATPTSVQGLFYDLERVEVLKGPQGTLYGRNATGGAINVIPRRPDLGGASLDLNLEVGNYERISGSAAINLPVTETSALRAAVQVVHRDGFLSDGTDDESGEAVRLSYLIRPSADVSINIIGDYAHQGGDGGGSTVRKLCSGRPCFVADPWTGLQDLPQAFTGVAPPSRRTFLDNDYYGISGVVDITTGAGTLTLVPAYRRSSVRFNTDQPGFQIIEHQQPEQVSMEARFASPSGRTFNWLIGGYYLHTSMQARSNTENASRRTYSDQFINTSGETAAAFANLSLSLTPSFRLTGGARYTWEEKSSNSIRYTLRNLVGPDPVIPAVPTVAPSFTVDQSRSFDAVTWRGGFEWDAGPRSLVYANVSTGFKAGGFFFGPPGANSYDPEHVTSYVLGSKNRFLDNRLQLNVEAFYLDYRDQQLSYVKLIPPAVVLVTENIGQVTVEGIEVESEFLVTPDTRIGVQLQWMDATADRLVYNTIAPPPAATSRCRITGTNVDCSGLPALRAPDWVVAASFEQTFHLGNGGRSVGRLFGRYESARELDVAYIPETHEGGSTRTDASLTYEAPGGRWSVSAFVNNIEDDAVASNVTVNPAYNLNQVVAVSLRPPRTFGLRFSGHF